MNNTTPEGFRTAAYLAAKARLDARKTTRNVQCNPPNVRCGNRCIPPSWDCRLKGQGTDPHLRAVKTDPLGGLANIQRGASRITRGIVRGNFSEVEGGKRAIIRGAVKVAPGNIQQKKELQKKLEDRTRAIGIGLAVVTGGLGIHAILMKNNTFGYRNGLGANINSATRAGISRVFDSLPLVGTQRARTRGAVSGVVGAATSRFATEAVSGPDALRATLGSGGESVLSRTPLRDNAGQLVVDTNRVDRTAASSSDNFYAWNQKHREAFWTSSINEAGVGGERGSKFSVFARPTAEEHLSRQFQLTGDEALTTRSIKDALTNRIDTERGDLIALAKQQGYRVSRSGGREAINEADLGTFMRGVVRTTGGTSGYSPTIRRELESHLEGVLTRSPSAYANTIYGRTVRGFNDFYKEVGDIARNTAGASALDPALRQRGYAEILGSADLTRARYLSGRMNLTRPIAGEAHAELVRTAYFATRVAGTRSSTYSITDRLALSAASELAGRPVTTTADAMRLLQSEYGFTGAVRVRAPREATPRPAAPSTTGQPRSARRRLRSRSELIRTLTQGGLSAEAAAAEADRIIARRGDEDDFSPELVRTATYLAARADFKEGGRLGKPCGASHIPKAHECRKGQGASSPESAGGKTAAKVALVAGVAVGAAALATNPKLRQRARVEARLLLKGSDNAVREALKLGGRGTVAGLSAKQVKEGLSKLPEALQAPARKLVGAAKQGAAAMALKAEGYTVQDIDVANNFSTWKNKKGTLISIGSYGDSLVTYASDNSHSWNGKRVYKIGFNVDQSFDATRTIPTEQARTVTSAVRRMTDNHLNKINDGVLATFPWDGDDYGSKRRAIYTRAGFNNIVGEESQWALVQKGRIKKMTSSESFVFLAESGERDAPIYKPTKRERKDDLTKPDGRR